MKGYRCSLWKEIIFHTYHPLIRVKPSLSSWVPSNMAGKWQGIKNTVRLQALTSHVTSVVDWQHNEVCTPRVNIVHSHLHCCEPLRAEVWPRFPWLFKLCSVRQLHGRTLQLAVPWAAQRVQAVYPLWHKSCIKKIQAKWKLMHLKLWNQGHGSCLLTYRVNFPPTLYIFLGFLGLRRRIRALLDPDDVIYL